MFTRSLLAAALCLTVAAPALADDPDDTELAQRALDYLGRQLDLKRRTVKGVKEGKRVAAANGLLAFIGKGHSHRYGTLKLAVRALLNEVKGGAAPKEEGFRAVTATAQALGELYAISRDFTLKKPAQTAIDAVLAAQDASGGFGQKPGAAPDVLSTVRAVLALKSAKTAGLSVNRDVFSRVQRFLVGRIQAGGKVDAGPAASAESAQAGLPLALMFCGVRRSDRQLRSVVANPPPIDKLDLEGCYLHLYTAFQVGGKVFAAAQKAVSARIGELANRNRGAKGGADKSRDAFLGTTYVVQTLSILDRYARARVDEETTAIPPAAIRETKSFGKFPAAERDALIRALNGACGQRWAKGYKQSNAYLEQHAQPALDVLGELLASSKGPASSYAVKAKVFSLLQRVRPKAKPGGVVRLRRAGGFHERSIPHLVEFLQTNPPVAYAGPITAFLNEKLAKKGVVALDTSYKKRRKIYKAYKKAAKRRR